MTSDIDSVQVVWKSPQVLKGFMALMKNLALMAQVKSAKNAVDGDNCDRRASLI